MAALTDGDVRRFHDQGFVVCRGFLSPEEAGVLSAVVRADPRGRGGGSGNQQTELLGLPKGDPERPKTTIYDAVCYSDRMIKAMGRLLLGPGSGGGGGGAVTLHHRKIIMKDKASAGNAPAGRAGDGEHSHGGGYGGGNRFACKW
eukprot:SAG22_NODE_34_length_27479_cov_10.947480_5_plen_145_part_00